MSQHVRHKKELKRYRFLMRQAFGRGWKRANAPMETTVKVKSHWVHNFKTGEDERQQYQCIMLRHATGSPHHWYKAMKKEARDAGSR